MKCCAVVALSVALAGCIQTNDLKPLATADDGEISVAVSAPQGQLRQGRFRYFTLDFRRLSDSTPVNVGTASISATLLGASTPTVDAFAASPTNTVGHYVVYGTFARDGRWDLSIVFNHGKRIHLPVDVQ
jgi:hypothetical protein